MHTNMPTVDCFFPFWENLPQEHREDLQNHSQPRRFEKGAVIHPYKDECLGLILVQSGQFRAFVISETGKEVTLYRLFERDICLFSASCIMNNIQFDIHIEAEKDVQALLVSSSLYGRLMEQSVQMANYTNQLMSSRFSDVMWTLEQVLFKSMDSRIAQFLLQRANIEGTTHLELTHDVVAKDLCTAREVVTRMLKYFRNENILELGRGRVTITNMKKLQQLAEG